MREFSNLELEVCLTKNKFFAEERAKKPREVQLKKEVPAPTAKILSITELKEEIVTLKSHMMEEMKNSTAALNQITEKNEQEHITFKNRMMGEMKQIMEKNEQEHITFKSRMMKEMRQITEKNKQEHASLKSCMMEEVKDSTAALNQIMEKIEQEHINLMEEKDKWKEMEGKLEQSQSDSRIRLDVGGERCLPLLAPLFSSWRELTFKPCSPVVGNQNLKRMAPILIDPKPTGV